MRVIYSRAATHFSPPSPSLPASPSPSIWQPTTTRTEKSIVSDICPALKRQSIRAKGEDDADAFPSALPIEQSLGAGERNAGWVNISTYKWCQPDPKVLAKSPHAWVHQTCLSFLQPLTMAHQLLTQSLSACRSIESIPKK